MATWILFPMAVAADPSISLFPGWLLCSVLPLSGTATCPGKQTGFEGGGAVLQVPPPTTSGGSARECVGLECRVVPHRDAMAAVTPWGCETSLSALRVLPSTWGAPSFPSLAAGSHPTCDSALQYLHPDSCRVLQEHPINALLRCPW